MKWHVLVAAPLLAGLAIAQQPTPSPSAEPKPAEKPAEKPASGVRSEQRARSMRREIEEGQVLTSHVKVRVRLQNGNRLEGVVKDGKLVERVNELRFVAAQAKERGAGIRIWYTGDTRSYIFVPFESLASYQVMERISPDELRAIEIKLKMTERRVAAKRRAQAKSKAAAKGSSPAGGPEASSGPKPTSLEALEKGQPPLPAPGGAAPAPPRGEVKPPAGQPAAPSQKERDAALLATYPPKLGWNEAKKNEISRRLAVIGAKPSEKELEFVKQFDAWIQACERSGVDPNAGAVEERSSGRRQRN
jgi:hypothetical protein